LEDGKLRRGEGREAISKSELGRIEDRRQRVDGEKVGKWEDEKVGRSNPIQLN